MVKTRSQTAAKMANKQDFSMQTEELEIKLNCPVYSEFSMIDTENFFM